jgi:hypothetical protein
LDRRISTQIRKEANMKVKLVQLVGVLGLGMFIGSRVLG